MWALENDRVTLTVLSVPSTTTQPVLLDHVCPLLRDHDGGRVGVSADDGRHDAGVDHSQVGHSVDAQPRIHHGLGVTGWTHLARTHGVVDGHGQVADGALPISVRAEKVLSTSGQRDAVKTRVELSKGGPLAYLEVQTYMRILDDTD